MKVFSTDADHALRGLRACHMAGVLFTGLQEMIQVLWCVAQILRGLGIGQLAGVLKCVRTFFGSGQTADGMGEARVSRSGLLATGWRDQPVERRLFATNGDRISASKTGPAAIICPGDNGRGAGVFRRNGHLGKDLWHSLERGKVGSIHARRLMGLGVQG